MAVPLNGRVVDGTAFEKLVEAHHSEIHRYLGRVVALGAAADDLSVETFLRAFRHRRSLPADSDLRGWLFAIATQRCRNHFRRARRAATSTGGGESRSASGIHRTGEMAQDAPSRLAAIIRGLPVSQRLAFTMRRFHDLGYDAIGVSLGCSPERARTHVFDALRRIRRELDASAMADGESQKPMPGREAAMTETG